MRIKDKPIATSSEPIAVANESLVSIITISFSVDVISYYTLYYSHRPFCTDIAARSINERWLKKIAMQTEVYTAIIAITISYCSFLICLIFSLSWSTTSVLSLRPSSLLSNSGVLITLPLTSLGG